MKPRACDKCGKEWTPPKDWPCAVNLNVRCNDMRCEPLSVTLNRCPDCMTVRAENDSSEWCAGWYDARRAIMEAIRARSQPECGETTVSDQDSSKPITDPNLVGRVTFGAEVHKNKKMIVTLDDAATEVYDRGKADGATAERQRVVKMARDFGCTCGFFFAGVNYRGDEKHDEACVQVFADRLEREEG